MAKPANELSQRSSGLRRCVSLILVLAYLLLLLWCYRDVISPAYSYAGLWYYDLEPEYLFAAVLLTLVPVFILPTRITRPSDYASWFLYLAVVLPASFVPPLVVPNRESELTVVTTLVFAYLIFELVRCRKTLKLPYFQIDDTAFRCILPLVLVIIATAIFAHANFSVNLSFGESIYQRRLAARQVVGEWSPLAYLNNFAVGIGVPFLSALFLIHRDWLSLPVLVYVVVAVFSFDGEKAALFDPILFLCVGWLSLRHWNRGPMFTTPPRPSVFYLLAGFLAVLVFSLLEPVLFGTSNLAIMIVRRELIMPAQLSAYYFDFWADNPLVWMGDGWLGRLGITHNPYPYGVPMVIGAQYFGSPDTNANVNLWAAAFAHFGYIGTFVTSAAAAFLLRLVDSFAVHGRLRYLTGCVFAASFGLTWTNCAFHTSLLSNGVLLGIILLAILPTEARGERERSSPWNKKSFIPGWRRGRTAVSISRIP
jgi:hypothetical protein